MADLKTRFETAASDVKTKLQEVGKKPTNEELLQLYGLYKQATVGDNSAASPWSIQLEAKAKWDAWESRKGMSKDDAMEKYVGVVADILKKYLS
eukprot:CAMPEP_0168530472 /NCGR_PEP_ID=MMETSP0405-20121227/14698_1 /TAXON_ID=498012 /ORGANISM="Trichosphaerium sp, Strain Am-I-7 wt" /LENGTH=93 /DNA_ID=CAMNT_0008554741 /DNA_START=8 /DNA_END=289 /DNA_ORIENTATION=+